MAVVSGALIGGLLGSAPAEAVADPLQGKFTIRSVSFPDRCAGWGAKNGPFWVIQNLACSETKRTTWTYNAQTQQLVSDGECAETYRLSSLLPILTRCEDGKSAQKWKLVRHWDHVGGYAIHPVDHPDLVWSWNALHNHSLNYGSDNGDRFRRFHIWNA